MSDWVMEYAEKEQNIREKAVVQFKDVSGRRTKLIDKKAIQRKFVIGDKVYYKVPGLEGKLMYAWEGPYSISKVLGPGTYELDSGGRRRKVAHISFIKEYVERKVVKRVTTVLEDDWEDDEVQSTNGKVKLMGGVVDVKRERDIKLWTEEFKNILTEELGLTNLVRFGIETGDSPPISQRPYKIPVALREGVEEEML